MFTILLDEIAKQYMTVGTDTYTTYMYITYCIRLIVGILCIILATVFLLDTTTIYLYSQGVVKKRTHITRMAKKVVNNLNITNKKPDLDIKIPRVYRDYFLAYKHIYIPLLVGFFFL